MKLIPNAWRVLTRSASMWCVYLSLLSEYAPYIIPYLDGVIPRWLSVAFLLAAPLMRVKDQGNLHADK
ncbi:hypothetical protein TAL182_CH02987 [Rhizobium sp. TAL182]|uniref:hypothetical protein n=1 Tax=Rhizobium sp. TAL182 TaxID=2020313 RepID=UPI000A20FC92|nr:hypothetical protein [Rhizobium sp. TAL182]ARO24733.1 hypothetical protein TAL182_CH02987 [Rhizobium sp. TAL182]